jgi:uncharacterized integral membrane protein
VNRNRFNKWSTMWEFTEILILIYLLTAIGLTPSGSSRVHIYTQTIHITTQLTPLVGGLSGIRTQIGQTKNNDELTA